MYFCVTDGYVKFMSYKIPVTHAIIQLIHNLNIVFKLSFIEIK